MATTSESLSQRDREFLAEFIDDMVHQLMKDGDGHAFGFDAVLEVANALKLDVDGIWVDLAAREAQSADGWGQDESTTGESGAADALARLHGRLTFIDNEPRELADSIDALIAARIDEALSSSELHEDVVRYRERAEIFERGIKERDAEIERLKAQLQNCELCGPERRVTDAPDKKSDS